MLRHASNKNFYYALLRFLFKIYLYIIYDKEVDFE